jgi:hypothetical protein
MSLYQCVSFGPARRYRFPFLEDKPAIHQAWSWALHCALLTWTRCSRSGSSRRPGLC